MLDYIFEQRKLSFSDSKISNALVSVGWDVNEVQAALESSQEGSPESSQNVTGEHMDSKPSLFSRYKTVLLVTILIIVVGGAGVFGYGLLANDSPESPDSPLNPREITVEFTNPIIAYIESYPNDYARNVVFYDMQKKEKLPADPILQSNENSFFQLGSWSPSGQYLPILKISSPGTDDKMVSMYLFDSQSLQIKNIYSAPGGEENFVWAGTFNFLSGWIDDSKFVVVSDRNTNESTTTLTYFTLDGELNSIQQPDLFTTANRQLIYTTSFYVDTQINAITVGDQTLNFAPEGTIVGVVDNQLVVLKKPVAVSMDFDFDGGTGGSKEWEDFESQLKELGDQGMSQEELSQMVLNFLEPKGDTFLHFYNLATGVIEAVISLTDDTWQTLDVLVHPSEKLLVAHQTNAEFLPTKERFITIRLDKDPMIEVLFENDLILEHNHNYSGGLLLKGNSFYLSNDGNWIIGERGSITDDPANSSIFMFNINTGEEIFVCSQYCSGVKVYYPLALERRY